MTPTRVSSNKIHGIRVFLPFIVQVFQTTLQISAKTVIFLFVCSFFLAQTNSTIIQVKAACDQDNMRIVAELNSQHPVHIIHNIGRTKVGSGVFHLSGFLRKHYSFLKLHVLLLLCFFPICFALYRFLFHQISFSFTSQRNNSNNNSNKTSCAIFVFIFSPIFAFSSTVCSIMLCEVNEIVYHINI